MARWYPTNFITTFYYLPLSREGCGSRTWQYIQVDDVADGHLAKTSETAQPISSKTVTRSWKAEAPLPLRLPRTAERQRTRADRIRSGRNDETQRIRRGDAMEVRWALCNYNYFLFILVEPLLVRIECCGQTPQ
jgi:hypothetical protein